MLKEKDRLAIQALMDRDHIAMGQAAVEVEGANGGESFVIRASKHRDAGLPVEDIERAKLYVKPRSWTRTSLASAAWVARGARDEGYEEVHVYYRTTDGYLVEQTNEEMQAAIEDVQPRRLRQ